MKKWLAMLLLSVPSNAMAEMDDQTYMVEMEALATVVALEQECSIAIDPSAMVEFATSYFDGKESDVLSEMDVYISEAKYYYTLEDASDLHKKILCATAKKYIEKHGLQPAN